jgi:hypothetical protein
MALLPAFMQFTCEADCACARRTAAVTLLNHDGSPGSLTELSEHMPWVRLGIPQVSELAAAEKEGGSSSLEVQQPQRRVDGSVAQLACGMDTPRAHALAFRAPPCH